MREETKFGIWSDNNYFAFVSSGKKIWRTIYHSYEVHSGDILFIKKGANLTHQFFDDEFCGVFIFIPDEFIKEFLKANANLPEPPQKDLSGQDAVLRIAQDELLDNYLLSIRSYLTLSEKPDERLIKLKFEELLMSFFSGDRHRHLTDYFVSLCQDQQHQMSRIMEQNFAYNLRLENFAQLCHMSLSAFKIAFKQLFGTTPGVWLKARRLDLACHQLLITDMTVSQIAFECGFEATAHFIRSFKEKYQLTPLQYRQKYSKTAVPNDLISQSPDLAQSPSLAR
jgi:AraC-like DNA-binding protein